MNNYGLIECGYFITGLDNSRSSFPIQREELSRVRDAIVMTDRIKKEALTDIVLSNSETFRMKKKRYKILG